MATLQSDYMRLVGGTNSARSIIYTSDDSDTQNLIKIGDTVKIMETKPYSKTKRWRITEIVERAR